MKIPVIDLYKDDFSTAYIVNNKDRRKRVILIGKDKTTRKGMLLARYKWEEAHGKIPEGMQIDHIDDDPTNDDLSNLQLLTQKENSKKYRDLHPPRLIMLKCPVCDTLFMYEFRNLSSHKGCCCSRRCGSIKGHQIKLTKKKKI